MTIMFRYFGIINVIIVIHLLCIFVFVKKTFISYTYSLIFIVYELKQSNNKPVHKFVSNLRVVFLFVIYIQILIGMTAGLILF